MAKRARLPEGAYKHPPCEHCIERPAPKVKIDTDKRWVIRQRFCEGDVLVDFSLTLQLERPEGWRDVARWSVAHSNFHAYQFYWNPKKDTRHDYGPVDTVEQVAEAYHRARNDAYPRTEQLLATWWKGPT